MTKIGQTRVPGVFLAFQIMNDSTRRILSFLTLSAWGGILLYFHLSGRIVSFLHPFFRPLVLIAGIGLVLLAIGYWWASRKGVVKTCCGEVHPEDHAHCDNPEHHKDHAHHDGCCGGDHGAHSHLAHGEECGHAGHAHAPAHAGDSSFGRIASFLVLLVPVLTAAAFSPDEFGRNAIMNRGVILDASMLKRSNPTATVEEDWLPLPGDTDGTLPPAEAPGIEDYLPRTAEGNIKAEVIDLIFGAEDSVIRQDFDGRMVEVVGQIMKATEANPTGTRHKLVRMFMVCCAADARPVAIMVDGIQGEIPAEMSWVRVKGKATFPTESGRRLVVVESTGLERTDPPQETMLY